MDCERCLKSFNFNDRKPYLISPCGHSYCKICLDNLVDEKCPDCRCAIECVIVNRGVLHNLTKNKAKSLDLEFQVHLDEAKSLLNKLVKNQNDKDNEHKTIAHNLKSAIQREKQCKIDALERETSLLIRNIDEIENNLNNECESVIANFSGKVQQFENVTTEKTKIDIKEVITLKQDLVSKIAEKHVVSFEFKPTVLSKRQNVIGQVVFESSMKNVDITAEERALLKKLVKI